MRINGQWHRAESGDVVPQLLIEIRTGDGEWVAVPFLVDTGAERTAFTYEVLDALQLEPEPSDGTYLTGVGGVGMTVLVATSLRLTRDDGQTVSILGTFYGFTDPIALDLSVLGRDVLSNFAAIVDRPGQIVDRPGQAVALVAGQHRYQIVAAS